jgi:hypothetical protein
MEAIMDVIVDTESRFCSDPDIALGIFIQRPYRIGENAVRVGIGMSIDSKFISVVLVQSIKCAKPHKPDVILNNASYIWMGKSVPDGEMFKLNFLPAACVWHQNKYQSQNDRCDLRVFHVASLNTVQSLFTIAISLK